MSKVYIHIGLHKTGTTFLQKQYFPKIKEISYLGKIDFHVLGQKKLKEDILISYEGLSGFPWNSQWIKGTNNSFNWMNSFEIALENVKLIFPDAHLIVVFRKHGDLLISLYKQYLQEGGVLKIDEFYGPNGVITDRDLNFRKRIEFLKDNFEDVDILSFEKFKNQGISYFLNYFSDLKMSAEVLDEIKQENISVSGKKIELLRKSNIVYHNIPFFIKKILYKVKQPHVIFFKICLKYGKPQMISPLK